MWQCHYCRAPVSLEIQERNRLCPSCGSDLHSCMNCSFYDENLTSKCKESESPWIADRATFNSCEYFEFKKASGPESNKSAENSSEAERAKEAFRNLFRQP